MFFNFFADGVEVGDKYLNSMMSLQNLEKLDVEYLTDGFGLIDKVPDMKKLCKFHISFYSPLVNMGNLYNAVEKMPNLEWLQVIGLSEEQTLEFTCKAINMAISQKKDVVIQKFHIVFPIGIRKERLKIESQNSKQSESDDKKYLFLHIKVDSETYFDDVTAFVRRTLKDHLVFDLDDCWVD